MTTPEIQQTVSPSELAALAGYTPASIYYQLQQGHIKAFRDAKGLWRIPMPAARAFINRPKYSRDYA